MKENNIKKKCSHRNEEYTQNGSGKMNDVGGGGGRKIDRHTEIGRGGDAIRRALFIDIELESVRGRLEFH